MSLFDTYCASGLISAKELQEILEQGQRIHILDASFELPNSDDNAFENYKATHIEGAQFFDICEICDKHSDLPHMLPSSDEFAEAIGALGIKNGDAIVVYGQKGLVMGPARAWCMFRVFGHDRICVLDGGLPAWLAVGGEVVADEVPAIQRVDFTPSFRPELVKNLDQVNQASQHKAASILDARPAPRFTGEAKEPRAGMNSGHIPNSLNVPASSLIAPDTQMMKSKSELQAILGQIDSDSIITTCGSGVTACVIVLALFKLGVKNASVFDGSWSQWGNPAYNMHFNTG